MIIFYYYIKILIICYYHIKMILIINFFYRSRIEFFKFLIRRQETL